jgi:hypothetical protein
MSAIRQDRQSRRRAPSAATERGGGSADLLLGGLVDLVADQRRTGAGQGPQRTAWWLLSLLIGPIATLLIVIVPGLSDNRQNWISRSGALGHLLVRK